MPFYFKREMGCDYCIDSARSVTAKPEQNVHDGYVLNCVK